MIRKICPVFPALLFCMSAAVAENPLEFREYTQTVRLEFASPAEAQKAELRPNALPRNFKLALSARWDDSAWEHLRTLEHMKKYGIKGTFYHNNPAWCLRRDPDYLKRLQTGGCSPGLHTLFHPDLTGVDSVTHFREYMKNRIMLETLAQTCINSQVLPFCAWWEPLKHIPNSIGHAMRAAGVISSPDVMMLSKDLADLGYPAKSLACSRLLTPGDKVPSLPGFEKQLKNHLADQKTLAKHPSISMAMHSWHTEEGLKNLDIIFERLSGHADWWYCNQTEYGAYRYEALNCSVGKRVDGNRAVFTVTRMRPSELGADVPLWFTVAAAAPRKAAGGRLHGTLFELPHDSELGLPEKIGRMNKNGVSSEFPGLKLSCSRAGDREWRAEIVNNGQTDLLDCEFTFRFPAVWEKPTLRTDLAGVKSGETATAGVVQPSRRTELYFQYGAPYAALQMDFRMNGERCRLYAEWEEAAPRNLPLTPNDAALVCEAPEEIDPAFISQATTDLAAMGLSQSPTVKKRSNTGPASIHPDMGWTPKTNSWLSIVDFEVPTVRPLKFSTRVLESWLKSEMWFNGKRIGPPNAHHVELKPHAGRNRLLFKTPPNRCILIGFDDSAENTVKFLPPVKRTKENTW